MADEYTPSGGENFSLREIFLRGRKLNFPERTRFFSQWLTDLGEHRSALYMRKVMTTADREVIAMDPTSGQSRPMLMFGSNNYLGLANHPYVRERVKAAVDEFGAGVGGPPLLNAYTRLHRELEERLSALKGKEETLLFQSGYGANVGILSSVAGKHDTIVCDAYSHASFMDGIRMSDAASARFPHNDVEELERILEGLKDISGDVFVGVEGVYSMDGDLAPLEQIAPLCRRYNATLLLDDAHGTCVLGDKGAGTAEYLGVADQVDIVMGTLSKAFAVTGAFVSTSRPIADYLRYFARSYMFSSAIPPASVAAVLAGLDLLERDATLQQRLHDNVAYAVAGLRRLGFKVNPQAGVIALIVPQTMNMRKAAVHFHRAGIFLNSVEFPAVPAHLQRFRISMMATHTKADIDRLLEVVEEVWSCYNEPEVSLLTESTAGTRMRAATLG